MHPSSFVKIVGGVGAIALSSGCTCTCNGCPPDDWDTAELRDTDTDEDTHSDQDTYVTDVESDSTCTQRESETTAR